jgi:hypothetical protein
MWVWIMDRLFEFLTSMYGSMAIASRARRLQVVCVIDPALAPHQVLRYWLESQMRDYR